MYANIIVDISHEKLDKVFQYRIPKDLENLIKPGTSVTIPFGNGNRMINGFVIELTDVTEYDELKIKDIASINNKNVPIEGALISLAWFIKENYGSTMNQALKTVIPIKKVTKESFKRTVCLNISDDECVAYLEQFQKKHATARHRLLVALKESKKISYDLIVKKLNISAETIRVFETMGIIKIEDERIYRNPININNIDRKELVLSEEQIKVINDICESNEKVHLIYGITGSGKTEVYMNIIDRVIKEGKQAIVLIPEIALTYQTVMRFYGKFGDRVSIINSKLSDGERFDQFERAKKGEIDIMIGPRSAIFTPFKNLGLIVIDEEHENTYKSENVPKYHAREVAIFLAKQVNAKVVLGSATPSVYSYNMCEKGEFKLHKLSKRAVAKSLPEVSIVDLREEMKNGNRSMFSVKLQELIKDRLDNKKQIMLFINRRGYAGFVSCRSCGKPIKCPHCDVGLNLHNNNHLVCHYCGYDIEMPKKCPNCESPYIAAFGTGTQKVEEAVKKLFNNARVLRMDMDTTSKKDGHEKILTAFANHEADILVGTQMIVKGHDFPNVTLVGVIAADLSLFASDYMSAERTFDLLTQAAGRAGRGIEKGEVVIQTYNPDEYSIRLAASQDYEEFYETEMLFRNLNGYPPAVNLMAILMKCEDYNKLVTGSECLKEIIKSNNNDICLIGPADCTIGRISDIYRRVMYIKSPEMKDIISIKNKIEVIKDSEEKLKDISILFDLNPIISY